MNPNIYIVIKQARVNVPESYIRYGFVVEGDFVAYADKFVDGHHGEPGRGRRRKTLGGQGPRARPLPRPRPNLHKVRKGIKK